MHRSFGDRQNKNTAATMTNQCREPTPGKGREIEGPSLSTHDGQLRPCAWHQALGQRTWAWKRVYAHQVGATYPAVANHHRS